MKCKNSMILLGILLSFKGLAVESFYCSENHQYISVGMNQDQVIAACGQPVSKQISHMPLAQKITVQQLVYNNQGTDNAFYGVWNLPTGSGGVKLVVSIVNNKVRDVKMDGGGNNAFSVCNGVNINIGDPIGKVYGACGNPAIVNTTFLNEPLPTNKKPEIWVFQSGQFQPVISLTFVDGKLKFINQ
jgi:hypothetical protein